MAQLLEHWDPLNLPRGSIRALITLTLHGVLWSLMVLGREITPVFAGLVLAILGHYLGTRSQRPGKREPAKEAPQGEAAAAESKAAPPLWLPRGSVRTLLLLGYAAVAYHLRDQGKLELSASNRSTAILFMAGALQVGFLVRGLLNFATRSKATAPRRFLVNVQSVVTILAAALLAIASCLGAEEGLNQNVALICAPIVGFYFGSRE